MATGGDSDDGAAREAARAPLPKNPYAKRASSARRGGQQTINSAGALSAAPAQKTKTRHGGSRSNSGRKLNNQTHGPKKIGPGSLEHAFKASDRSDDGPAPGDTNGADDADADTDAALAADAGATAEANAAAATDSDGGDANGGNELGSSDSEEPSWLAEANLQLRVGKNTGEEGYAYSRSKNMKQRTGIVKEAMKEVMTREAQKRALELVQSGQLWERPLENIGQNQPTSLQNSWKSFHRLSQFNWLLCGGILPPEYRPKCRCGPHDEEEWKSKSASTCVWIGGELCVECAREICLRRLCPVGQDPKGEWIAKEGEGSVELLIE